MCMLSNKTVITKIQKSEGSDQINSDLFFSTDCKILINKNSKKSSILIATRKMTNTRNGRLFLR